MLAPIHNSPAELGLLITKLHDAEQSTSKKGKARKFVNQIGSNQIESWKFNEWDYYKKLVPCQARGLFTCGPRIVVRGYDKFFNIGEVPDTKEDNLAKNTVGPFDLTVKENGCIIFVGGLEDGNLLVCSKHSTGARLDLTRNHAVEGEVQLRRQLALIGKSVEDLAKLLYENNITLAMELCDDTFEEHILSYSGREAGLYLHGINFNTIDFKTYPITEVEKFAEIWGFKVVKSLTIDSFDQLMKFLKDVEALGTWNGREIEGFVVRCGNITNDKSSDYFFKFKFEQPYLLYRNFREVTKKMLDENCHKPVNEILKRFKSDKFIIAKYIEFVKEYFEKYPEKRQAYLEGYGIIELRKLFLNSLGLSDISGMNLLDINQELATMVDQEKACNKYVIIPIATIGCGKTTIAYTLKELFDWGHVHNDNISNNKQKNQLVKLSLEALTEKPLVIVDRNNHQKRERKQLFDQFYDLKVDYLSSNDNLVFIGLNFIPDTVDSQEIDMVTYDRIAKRGDNHQSIKNDTDPQLAKKVMKGFISRFQPVDSHSGPDTEFDTIIDVDFRADTFVGIKGILSKLQAEFPDLIQQLGGLPDDEAIKGAITKSLEYKPTFTKTFGPKRSGPFGTIQTQKKKKKIDYFGVQVDHQSVLEMLQQYCTNNDLWNLLKSLDRVQSEFHVTLAHSSSLKVDNGDPWEELCTLLKAQKKAPETDFHYTLYKADISIRKLVISEIVIFLVVEITQFYNDTPVKVPILNKHLHITIGTFKPEIKPFVSNTILDKLYEGSDLSSNIYPLEYENQAYKVQVVDVSMDLTDQTLFSHYH